MYRRERAQGRPVSEAGRVNLRVPHFDKVVLVRVQQVLVRLRPQQVRIVGGVGLLVLALVRVAFDMPVVAELIEYVEAALLLEERARARFLEPARSGNRRFWLLSPLRNHTKALQKPDSHRKTLRPLKRPGRGRTGSSESLRPAPPLASRARSACTLRTATSCRCSPGVSRVRAWFGRSVGRSRRGRQGGK
jgi:hypothetical protein